MTIDFVATDRPSSPTISVCQFRSQRRYRDRFASLVSFWLLVAALVAYSFVVASAAETVGVAPASYTPTDSAASASQAVALNPTRMQIKLRSRASVAGNLIRVQDLLDADSSTNTNQQMAQTALAPSPPAGQQQTWTREDLAILLQLRGISPQDIEWLGASECIVRRSEQITPSPPSETNTPDASFVAASAARTVETTSHRNASDAIISYLKTVSLSEIDYQVQVDIPAEAIKLLSNRRHIQAVAGGTEPWVGEQTFHIKTVYQNQETIIEARAHVELPVMVYATNRSLGRDHILSESDLKLVSVTRFNRVTADECFTDLTSLVGKQLNRTLATGQPILRSNVANPRLIEANDPIEIQVVSAGLTVTSTGRALQGGGKDDLILVEVLPHRSKLAARVMQSGVVSVVAVSQ